MQNFPTTPGNRKLQPIGQTKSADPKEDEFIDNYLKDYDSLLKYCMKLIEDNKNLLTESCDLRKDNDEILKMNLELLEENQSLRKEKEKLVEDSLSVIEYNEQLMDDKQKLETELSEIKDRFDSLLSNLPEDVKKELLKVEDDGNNSESNNSMKS